VKHIELGKSYVAISLRLQSCPSKRKEKEEKEYKHPLPLLAIWPEGPWTNFSLQDEPWAEFSTLEVAAACIPCTYCPVLQYNLT
jgi:hypothetical protein